MDKHLLAENPMRAPDGGLCIIRTIQPISMYEVTEGREKPNGIYKNYIYTGAGEVEHYTLRVHHFFSADIDTATEEIAIKFMDDAWFWFRAYMEWQDKQIENEG